MAQSPELQLKISQWRKAALQGTLSKEDCKEALKALAEDRVRAGKASAASKKRKAAEAEPAKSGDDLLAEFENL